MTMIEVKNLTKDYGGGRGVFDVNLEVRKGEVFGFLGPNGAGKTTTIRNLLGFIRPDSGSVRIDGMDCFRDAARIHRHTGYLAGELAFFDDLTGRDMIGFMARMKDVRDEERIRALMERFDLDASGKIRKMSKGMKQKVGIVCAFMNDPEIIILDEPTSGLDPLMQNAFIDLIIEEKQRGKTIFMSSHIFEEVERTCDRTAIIRGGRIVAVEDMQSLKEKKEKSFVITFDSPQEAKRFAAESFEAARCEGQTVTVLWRGSVDCLIKNLAGHTVRDLDVKASSLEEIFLKYYGTGDGEKEAEK
ncbi:MAG: ATP-binding cassette domain-containing protein [Emergencia sp.]